MENVKKTQCELIHEYMKEFGSITALEAMVDIGCMRLASRISDLRRSGVAINSRTVCVPKKMGGFANIAEYSLA